MADLGKVVVTDGGTYSATVTYEKLTFVHYNNDAYLTLKTVKGVTPTDDGVNYRLFCKSAATATTSKAGIVMPDGTTISISNGKITAKTATQTTVGVTKGSDDITVGKDGALSLNTNFKQATALANIVAGEALKVVLGKVSKAIATTMNLDENALLKNMISGIDVNDGNKVPSSAYIHTLVDRIGMGTELSGFDNLTAAVNSVNNNLSGCVKLGGPALVNQVEISSGTPYIDFHFDNSEDDFTSRIIESTRGNLDFQCSDVRRNGSSFVDWQQLNNELSARLASSKVVNVVWGHGFTMGYNNEDGLYIIVDSTKFKIPTTSV